MAFGQSQRGGGYSGSYGSGGQNIFGGLGRGGSGGGGPFGGGGGGGELKRSLAFGFPMGSVFGIKLYIHITLLLLIAFSVLGSLFKEGIFGVIASLLAFGLLFGSVLLHELGHCWGTYITGGRNDRIILWPLGGLAVSSTAFRSPKAELLVVGMGPAVNVVILVLVAPLYFLLTSPTIESSGLYILVYFLVGFTVWVNAMLFFFNMFMPLFPMDGARILRALLALKQSPPQATMNVCRIGIWVGGLGILVSLFSNSIEEKLFDIPDFVPLGFFFALICVMGIFSCLQQMAMIKMRIDPVYTGYQPGYGGRAGYYIDDTSQWRPIFGSRGGGLSGFAKWFKSGGKAKPKGPAKVVSMGAMGSAADAGPETPRAKWFRELKQLEDDLRDAISSEDFDRAASLKNKIAIKKAASAPN